MDWLSGRIMNWILWLTLQIDKLDARCFNFVASPVSVRGCGKSSKGIAQKNVVFVSPPN